MIYKLINLKKQIAEKNLEVEKFRSKIVIINKQIQSSTSDEQEILHREISDLKAELAGLDVRRENFENRITHGKKKIVHLKNKIQGINEEMSKIQVSSPEIKEQQQKQKILQEQFDI